METSISTLLSDLSESLEAAAKSVPEPANSAPPKDGMSLLGLKNELLLHYVMYTNLLQLNAIRMLKDSAGQDSDALDTSAYQQRREDIVKKLVETRLYLEKGVKPLEGRLKYQIDKVLRATMEVNAATQLPVRPHTNGKTKTKAGDASDVSDAEADATVSDEDADELTYRPNPAAFMRPETEDADKEEPSDGLYRPPRLNPVMMPVSRPAEARTARPGKSATLDEFIANEMSTAPMAEPSIGSTIVQGGRRSKSAKERAEDEAKRVYEESNFVRLPKESKKDRKKMGPRENGFGGEDWRGLGVGLDRIERLTKRKEGEGGLERSRKRERTGDGEGERFGAQFAKRKKTVMGRFKR
ncbi:hypothetical protein EJ06DRAFT_528368 [Trichodelitschia bisporula]|uniref:Uncharacterized protein n=1 Tax=Trichodelitschia bisporula TaxID=703511 RepID=A0A6G1I1V5_9PEZI|nr:hypothetical protein EJ06DRAFT_528368 [Trichodelitschia bisporula]